MKKLLIVGSMALGTSLSAAVIDLSTPVGNTLTPDGIYWTFNNQAGPLVPDESGNGYNGTLTQGYNNPNWVNEPTLATGVNLPGTSGYGDGVSIIGKSTAYGSNQNPSVRYEASTPAAYAMDGVSFTGGTWLNMNTGASVVPSGYINMYLMSSGKSWNNAGHWALTLYTEDAGSNWYVGFQAGNNSTWSSGISPISNVMDGNWHHVGFNFNADTNVAQFWIDGTQTLGSVQLTNGVGAPVDYEDRTFRMGERVGSGGYSEMSFTGMFDDSFVTTGLHSFDFVPVPEPSAIALLAGVGVAVLVFRRRRK